MTKLDPDLAAIGIKTQAGQEFATLIHRRLSRLLKDGARNDVYFDAVYALRAELIVVLACLDRKPLDVLLGELDPAAMREAVDHARDVIMLAQTPAGSA